ncbi:hypothetical protein CHLRE_12g510252v5 [Chlamydomonas reinhardtii]|uniref:Uncharacterized protein n=1 Tax=Chlamydomonas reinhardtii TaxID=3055 RepID=A0A2K3D2N7_CHLRE|nr:uncharacterized protein CHLRE_12g510252v5 [Chlamydomonas reinhardtii]PNW74779.1 hypothetical protein CHLRE_12g510252v5 [Chlamydomonas reinhardtii]
MKHGVIIPSTPAATPDSASLPARRWRPLRSLAPSQGCRYYLSTLVALLVAASKCEPQNLAFAVRQGGEVVHLMTKAPMAGPLSATIVQCTGDTASCQASP